VPTGGVVAIRVRRVRRQIGYDGVFLSFERAERPEQRGEIRQRAAAPTAPITARDALRLLWEADRYPIRGNEDRRAAAALEKEARIRATTALTSPDDPAEFTQWLKMLLDESLPDADREAVMAALYDFFDPE
jgi:hypothetical protein